MSKRTAVGDLRPSQLIHTYGVGSIIDLPRMSVVVTGLEDWPTNPAYVREIQEDRLLTAVRYQHQTVKRLLGAPIAPEESISADPFSEAARIGVPVATFPRWLVCPQCRLLAPISSGLFSLDEKPFRPDRTVYRHINCSKAKKPEVIPARFLVACEAGHMDDFPWITFVHHQNECSGKPLLRLMEFGATGEARNLQVKCDACGQQRRLSDAFGKDNESNMPMCSGRRPHLRDYDSKPCNHRSRTIILGASNLWFPDVLSTVAIPVEGERLELLVDEYWDDLNAAEEIAVVKYLLKRGTLGVELSEYTPEAIWKAIEDRQTGTNEPVLKMPDIKAPEWTVFTACNTSNNNEDFHLSEVDLAEKWPYQGLIDQVVIVDRLREVRALVGFTRLDSAGELTDPDRQVEGAVAPLSRGNPEWVPTDEIRGEGLFLRFNENAIQSWVDQKDLKRWSRAFFESHVSWRKARKITAPEDGFPGLRYVLLHSFSHLLMRQLALESGYSTASIRERIYSRQPDDPHGPMAGLLLYTAASDSEGTLGGLASLGKLEVLARLIGSTLEASQLCAGDPLCAESQPSKDGRTVQAAACHACLLAPETSCERGNKYLDRSVVVPTLENEALSFFRLT